MYAVKKPVENPYLIRERDRKKARELLAFSVALIPPLCVLFWAMRANLETIQIGYQLGRLEKQREVLLEKRRQLEVERANAASLARTELIARASLGLGPARPDQIILVQGKALQPVPAPLPRVDQEPAGVSPSAGVPATGSPAAGSPAAGSPAAGSPAAVPATASTEEGF
ncbi:MAG: hypothetical protein L6R30_11925 [Thermoanaerobaculia bacterium]|nr:hypothetical protein [Thermoanaerobaculia bacterium]